MKDEKSVSVYAGWEEAEPIIGTLFYSVSRGTEIYSFEYATEYLASSPMQLDPELQLFKGRQFLSATQTKKIFGMFADCCPDRWGRKLLQRKELITAKKENRSPSELHEIEYLLGIQDEARSGGLRFKYTQTDAQFIGTENYLPVPPITSLRALQQASLKYESSSDLDNKWFYQLLEPGSSLGGARPKATVKDVDGSLWIAKFPSKNDTEDNCAWEKTVNDLAVLAGLNVAESRFEKFSGKSCFLSKRFDRVTKNGITNRIHFSSAMTQLARTDGDSSDASYLDIVEFLRSNSSEPQKDLEELWKRIVFNIAVSNTDDHLRNHGFLLTGRGWKLSPLYDITPNPDKDNLSLCITQTDNSKDMQLALATAKYYGISDVRAEKEVARIKAIVDEKWRATAAKYGISRAEMERMRGAFEEK